MRTSSPPAPSATAGPSVGKPVRDRAGAVRTAMYLAPPLATLGTTLWGLTSSSYWADEAATMSAVHRSFGQLLSLVRHVDVEHAAYYVLMWFVVRLGGSGELAARLPSALAMVAAAAVLTALGARIASLRIGMAAGLVFAVLPCTSYYAANARPDAWALALAVGATYLLVRVIHAADERGRRRFFAGYGACMTVLVLTDIFGLFLALAHAASLAWMLRGADRPTVRRIARGWLTAMLVTVVISSPLLLVSFAQRSQQAWIPKLSAKVLNSLPALLAPQPQPEQGSGYFTAAILLVAVIAVVVSAIRAGDDLSRFWRHWPRELRVISLPWLVVPGFFMLAVSVVVPVFFYRYLLFCVPALALLLGAAIVALGRVAGTAALVILLLLGLPSQFAIRLPNGHGDNIRGADRFVAAHMQPGDAIVFHDHSEESWSYAYPYGFQQLRNIGQAETPARSSTLTGTQVKLPVLQQRASHVQRLWVVDLNRYVTPTAGLARLGFRQVASWKASFIWVYLLVR